METAHLCPRAAPLRARNRAARVAGWNAVPMICSREIPVPGSMPRVIRVLLHVDSDGPRRHVYLRGAQALRPDLHVAPDARGKR